MNWRGIFRKRPAREIRASTGGYEAQRLRAAEFEAEVPHRMASVAEALISYFTRAAQQVKIESQYPSVTRAMLAQTMRSLMRRGESIWLIETGSGQPHLRPISSWSVTGRTSDPASWTYHLTDVGETTTREGDLDLLHFRLNVDPARAQPWRGQSPLELARRSLQLLAEADAQMSDCFTNGAVLGLAIESNAPIGREESAAMSADISKAFSKRSGGARRGGVLVLSNAKANAMKAASPVDSDLRQLRESLMAEVAINFGVPPGLIIQSRDTGGAARRELWREFLIGGALPVVRIIQAELQVKLDPTLRLEIPELLASDIASRARAMRSLVDAGVPMAEAKELTGLQT